MLGKPFALAICFRFVVTLGFENDRDFDRMFYAVTFLLTAFAYYRITLSAIAHGSGKNVR